MIPRASITKVSTRRRTGCISPISAPAPSRCTTFKRAGGVYPDGLAYDPELGKLYVSDETGGTDTVIDTRSNQVVAPIPLGGEVGNTQYDAVSHQILAAVQTRNQVVSIDPQSDQVTGRYDTPGCDHPHGLLISPDRRLAFVGCEGNARLVVLDLQSTDRDRGI